MTSAALRGVVAGGLAFVVLSTFVVALLVAVGGDAVTDRATDDPGALGVLLWVLVGVAAAGGGAVGAWQAAAGGAPGRRSAARIGAAGPLLVALVGLASDAADGPEAALASFALSALGAVAGAVAWSRRALAA